MSSPKEKLVTIDEFYKIKESTDKTFKELFEKGELKNTLPRGNNSFKEAIYTFKVYIDRNIWAKLQLDGMHTLHDLYNYIQEAFDFDNDHMYSFFMDGRAWSIKKGKKNSSAKLIE